MAVAGRFAGCACFRCLPGSKRLPPHCTSAMPPTPLTIVSLTRFFLPPSPQDGLDEVLSLLQAGNKHYRPTALSLLADLVANARSHEFFHEWRSASDKQTATHLLINIWKVRRLTFIFVLRLNLSFRSS